MNREKGYNCESGGSLNKFYCEETINKMTKANINSSQQSSAKSGAYKGKVINWVVVLVNLMVLNYIINMHYT